MSLAQRLERIEQQQAEILRLLQGGAPAVEPEPAAPCRYSSRRDQALARAAKNKERREARNSKRQ